MQHFSSQELHILKEPKYTLNEEIWDPYGENIGPKLKIGISLFEIIHILTQYFIGGDSNSAKDNNHVYYKYHDNLKGRHPLNIIETRKREMLMNSKFLFYGILRNEWTTKNPLIIDCSGDDCYFFIDPNGIFHIKLTRYNKKDRFVISHKLFGRKKNKKNSKKNSKKKIIKQ